MIMRFQHYRISTYLFPPRQATLRAFYATIDNFHLPLPPSLPPDGDDNDRQDFILSILREKLCRRDTKSYLESFGIPEAHRYKRSLLSSSDLLKSADSATKTSVLHSIYRRTTLVKLQGSFSDGQLDSIARSIVYLEKDLFSVIVIDHDQLPGRASCERSDIIEETSRVADALAAQGAKARPILGAFVRLGPKPGDGNTPTGDDLLLKAHVFPEDLAPIRSALRAGEIPVIPPFAVDSHCRSTHVGADDIVAALACGMVEAAELDGKSQTQKPLDSHADRSDDIDLTPERLMIVSKEGGIPSYARSGCPHSLINLTSEFDYIRDTFDPAWLKDRPSALSNLALAHACLSYMPSTASAIMVSHRAPSFVMANLMTENPAFSSSFPPALFRDPELTLDTPTLLRRGQPIRVIRDLTSVDRAKLNHLLHTSFQRTLDVDAFYKRLESSLDFMLIAGDYVGAAIVTNEPIPSSSAPPISYLDKFTVLPSYHGDGTVDLLWVSLHDESYGLGHPLSPKPDSDKGGKQEEGRDLVWRSRSNDPANKWYFERSTGHFRTGSWILFWCDAKKRSSSEEASSGPPISYIEDSESGRLDRWAYVVTRIPSTWKKSDDRKITIRQHHCESLYAMGRTKDAVRCFHQLMSELGEETNLHGEHLEWAHDFRWRSTRKLEHLGDIAANAEQHDVAISNYTTALSLDPPSPQAILIKRSKVFVATGSWKRALEDANLVIALDPSSPWGYEMKHGALHKEGDYESAIDAFETMLLKLAQSPDKDIQRQADHYISPSSTRATIRKIVQRTICYLPRVLINTTTGRLQDRVQLASTFESQPIFNELVSSMTTRIDYVWIKREVRQHFQYAMLSHKWEEDEPLYQQVMHKSVYDLNKSPTHDKLQTFCKIVRDSGFNWAWSDTCCINKSDHFVLQEALVAMFKWYQGCAMMIVFLHGVHSSSQRGALVQSIWNTRAWTLQEYIASKVIHFYTEDWTPYLRLKLQNHKESPEVISEMEQATGVSAQQLTTLRPGLSNIREKLRLASTRQTTLVEDAAYSLLGIFSVTGIPAIYGEGEGSLGRLLAHVLSGSGDVSILAWSGESGSFNSCLPAYTTVFNDSAVSHLPEPISDAEMEGMISTTHSPFDLDIAMRLYDRLNDLPAPWFAANRMKLPCIAFQLPPLSSYRTRSGRVYRADTVPFGMVEIKTRHDLSRMQSLYLVHPWLDTLLEREDKSNAAHAEEVALPLSLDGDDWEFADEVEAIDSDDALSPPYLDFPSLPAPSMDRETRARRLVAHLRRPFGALLFTLTLTGGRTVDYKRVAADSVITVQFQEKVSLAHILDNVRTLDVL